MNAHDSDLVSILKCPCKERIGALHSQHLHDNCGAGEEDLHSCRVAQNVKYALHDDDDTHH